MTTSTPELDREPAAAVAPQWRVVWARVLVVTAVALDLVLLFGGAALKPGYSQVSQFISELGATGTPWEWHIRWFGFVPLALVLAAFLVVAAPEVRVRGVSRVGYWLLFSQVIAYLGTALAPCDLGCPVDGSVTQSVHNLVGSATYPIAGIGIMLLAFAPALNAASRVALGAAAVLWFVLYALMLDPALAPWRGLLQRGPEVILFAVLLFIAWGMMPRTAIERPRERRSRAQ